MGNKEKMMNRAMELKFTSKFFQRQSRKCEKAEKLKVRKATEKGNIDGAGIYAENGVQKCTEPMNYLRLFSRLDAIIALLDTQAKYGIASLFVAARDPCSSLFVTARGSLFSSSLPMKVILVGLAEQLRKWVIR